MLDNDPLVYSLIHSFLRSEVSDIQNCILLMVCSSKSGDKLTSLDQYISRMKPGQKQIYFLTGSDRKLLEQSPFVEKLLKKGYEVRIDTEL